MTKVQIHYYLERPLTDEDAKGVADVHGFYGIIRVRPDAADGRLSVEYDASRLGEKEVEATLHRYGLPIKRRWSL